MSLRLSFLKSGSKGNCVLVEHNGSSFLIDIGVGIRNLHEILRKLDRRLEDINVVLLTHAHGDHVKRSALRAMAGCGTEFRCRREHADQLAHWPGFRMLADAGLVHFYGQRSFSAVPGVRVRPVPLSHDSPATHGFVMDFDMGSSQFRMVYIADCGSPDQKLARWIEDSDVVALEFNHDEEMERESGRPWHLIRRVIGPEGHLSNEDAAGLMGRIPKRGCKALVQVHLSEECNTPKLARTAAQNVVGTLPIYQAGQYTQGPFLEFA